MEVSVSRIRVGLLAVIDESTITRKLLQRMCPPLGLLHLAEYLRLRMPQAEVRWGYDPEWMIGWNPDLIGLSSVTENFGLAKEIAAHLRSQTDRPLVMGGVHLTLVPEQLPESCDLGVVGEGEETLLDLVGEVERNGSLHPERLRRIPGLVFRDGEGALERTPPRAPIGSLDSIPFPRRSRTDAQGVVHTITSRGCPYTCTFCSSPLHWGSFRQRTANHVVAELRWLEEHVNPQHIKLFDDLFIADRRRLTLLAEGMEDARVSFTQGMSGFARADLIDEESIGLLERLGVNLLSIGIESGSQRILDRLGKRTTVEINRRALELCRERGIMTCCSFIIGIPGETAEDLEATLQFIDENRRNISEIEICPAVPFPGSRLWDDARARGLVDYDMDWSRLRDYSIFTELDHEQYIYLNEVMSRDEFRGYCARFEEVYRHYSSFRTSGMR